MKHIIKVENFDNLSSVRPLIAMVKDASGEPEFSIKEPRTVITGTWEPSLTDNTKEVLIRGEVTLNSKTDCYSLMFEEGGHLTINAGARLRVWQGGIVNNDCTTVNYLTIVEDSVNDSYGEFLLHPGVAVNNHPLATVKYKCISGNINSSYVYGKFVIPFNTLSSITVDGEHQVRFWKYDYSSENWVAIGRINPAPGKESELLDCSVMSPFTEYQLYDFSGTSSGSVLTFIGAIVGNSISLYLRQNSHNGVGNSCVGVIKASALGSALPNGCIVYKYDGSQVPLYITPMLAIDIVTPNVTPQTYNLSYTDLVWDPSFEEDVTSTRSLLKGALTPTKPAEIDTTLEGSRIFDNPESPFPSKHDER